MLFDHVDLRVSDLAKARPLYDALLPAMGLSRISEDEESVCYYDPDDAPGQAFFGLVQDRRHRPNGSRLALHAAGREAVDRLAEVARAAQAQAFEPAHLCTEYSPNYYATFFEDADGNKLEICFRQSP